MIRITEILDKARTYLNNKDIALIQKAYVFSAAAHAGQTRLSGDPYLSHPLEVAKILTDFYLDGPTIASGLLHDTVEDTDVTLETIREQFGEDVFKIVRGVTKISKINFSSKEEAQAENTRKMILAMAEDIRVILVKLADRLHNMRTLEHQKEIKQKLIAQETLDIYAPLANRLGLYKIKVELEDLSLRYTKPDIYFQIEQGIKKFQTTGDQYIKKVCSILEDLLKKNKIQGRVNGRIKHIYSIYHKMETQGLTLDQVYDIVAFRVIVQNIKDCYAVLGLVHALWKPIYGRFKDYISMPKANMYQSLHTTVIGPDAERIEIQIRTEEMHKIAEYGVAAHWTYKEGDTKLNEKEIKKFSWLRQILDWQKELKDPREFINSLRCDLFQDEVYVFTPKGDVKELPEGATPIDFAYLIHSQIGDHCAGAKVNGKLVSLNTPLKNGDVVEIITDPSKHPSRDWLKFVKTAKARTRIKYWIRHEERESSIALGKEILEKEGRRLGLDFQNLLKEGKFLEVAQEFSLQSEDDLFSAVGYTKIKPRQVLNKFLPKADVITEKKGKKEQVVENKSVPGVKIKGVEDILVRFAKCCNPVPGDPIVGYISRGKGVTVHTIDCPNVKDLEPERRLSVVWDDETDQSFPVKIKINCENRPGMLAKITKVLGEQNINIESGTFYSNVDGNSELNFTILVQSTSHLYKAIRQVQNIKGIHKVVRLKGGFRLP
ncbi:MAG: bifunctional (p)ppGpp synthetase/guanosine-3',5'-bis(diphosphate) 3'-pyrophosphohydrolase [Desulfonauticus sp.]|nr:bifunctional (p)ppGpp synthetase/guanosine-3',5'-bis(diphosphate) 3'-pyrophosphohydrolase [Desulfonauticus sp.]